MSHSTVLLARIVAAALLAAHGAGPASAQTAGPRATVHQLRPPHSATGEISITALPVKKSWDVYPCRPQAPLMLQPR